MLRISLRNLRIAALATLLCPTVIFLLTWVRPLAAIPASVGLVIALACYVRAQRAQPDTVWQCPALALLCVLGCALLWTFLSGIGGMFYQNEDHYGRNAIFHDLLNHAWPVYFPGTGSALTYYIGYWLLPALVGKAAGLLLGQQAVWGVANAALFAQTVWFLVLVLLLLCALLQPRTVIGTAFLMLLFVLFSGMDGLMAAYTGQWQDQIEWWAGTYQYSSHTTCLFWVYNQAVPAWLAVLLLLSDVDDVPSFALIGLSSLAFAPLPLVGLCVLMVGLGLVSFARAARQGQLSRAIARCFSARNVLAVLCLLPVYALYYAANQATSDAPLRLETYAYAYGQGGALLRLLVFALVEFAAFALCMGGRYRREPLFVLACASLLVIPAFKMGYNMDFSMRASIPGLTVLCVYAGRFLMEAAHARRHRYAAALLLAFLLIGAITPMLEFERGAYKVKIAGTNRLYADPFGTVLHPDADTANFICADVSAAAFYTHLARVRP